MDVSIKRTYNSISVCIFCIYIVVANTPIFSSVSIELVLFGLWLLFRGLSCTQVRLDWKAIILFWICYEIVLRAIHFSTSAWGNYAIHILYFFPLFVFSSSIIGYTEKEKLIICKTYFWTMLINIIINVIMLFKYPQYNLLLNYADEFNGINLKSLNLGNTMFTYLAMLFSLCCFHSFCNGRKVFVFPFILSVLYVFISSKTTAILIMLVGILLVYQVWLSEHVSRGQRFIILGFGLIVLIVIYKVGIPFLANSISNNNIQERLNAIVRGDYGSEYFSRIELAKLSLESFYKHPIFGIGYELIDLSSSGINSMKIGHHSEIIDMLGRYGLVGVCINILIYCGLYRHVLKLKGDTKQKSFGKILFFIIFFYSILNNSIAVETGLFVFYIIPCICNGKIRNQIENVLV